MIASAFLLIPALVAAPPKPLPLVRAVDELLEQYDLEGQFPAPPGVAPRDRAALAWLLEGIRPEAAGAPFKLGHPSRKEALALLEVLKDQALPEAAPRMKEVGSQLRYWRWGARLVRMGVWRPEIRRRWEDQLLSPAVHPLFRGYALRHALCFALAEADEARFADLKARVGEKTPDLFLGFQTALALPKAFPPTLRLWSLPELAPVSVSLAQPGIRKVRIAQVRDGLIASPPADTLWIVPTMEGDAPSEVEQLDNSARREALPFVGRLPKDETRVFLAPVRSVLTKFGLAYFPIEIDLDEQGRVQRVRMGDAALAVPPAL